MTSKSAKIRRSKALSLRLRPGRLQQCPDPDRELERRVAQQVELCREQDRMLMQQARFSAMGEMIGNIAHQWRQPLNQLGILIQKTQMDQEAGTLKVEILEQRLAQELELLLRLSRTIDDFRTFFRPTLEPRSFKLDRAITRTVEFFQPGCCDLGIRVSLNGGSSHVFVGHVNEFSQALLNILDNARDALQARRVSDPAIVITLRDAGSRSIITIRDNAGGMAPEVLEKIFDPYFSTKEEGKGTGVGLYLARTIIERHMQGSIEGRTVAGGSEFTITL
jgi:signal transduction histidine kinase